MSMALPKDVPNEVVDVVQFAAMVRGTRKPIIVSSPYGGETVYTMHEMAAAAGAADSFACLAMTSPPLMLDDVCCTRALACADLDVPLVLAPSVSAGAQGPASLTAVAVANAEVLAGLVVHQLGRAGAPFVMGVGTGVMNMQHAVDVYNSPGVFLGNQAQLDVIRWYGLPSWHYSGHSDSKTLDEQWLSNWASPPSWARSHVRRCSTTWATWRAACRARSRDWCSATRWSATHGRCSRSCRWTTTWRWPRSRRWTGRQPPGDKDDAQALP